MRILVINSGSSSIKFSVYDGGQAEPRLLLDGEVSGIGQAGARLAVAKDGGEKKESEVTAQSSVEAARLAFDAVASYAIEAVGYRVVHPGPKLEDHQRITAEVLADLEEAKAFAPLHDPEAVLVIREGMARFPAVGHYACFDTVFHRTMPEEATTYPLPLEIRERGVRRYGFHGLSYESIVRQMAPEVPRRMVIAHLGSGCSVTALVEGRSVDTSMGLTPTGGVVMGTRPGDLDPGVVLYLLRQETGDATGGVEAMLNHRAGMVGLTGLANDMKAVRKAAASGDVRAVLALKVFTRSITKTIGGFCWGLGGVDAIVFAGGIGEHDAATRAEVLAGLKELGVEVNAALNLAPLPEEKGSVRRISASDPKTAVFVVPAQEDLMIAMHVQRMARLG